MSTPASSEPSDAQRPSRTIRVIASIALLAFLGTVVFGGQLAGLTAVTLYGSGMVSTAWYEIRHPELGSTAMASLVGWLAESSSGEGPSLNAALRRKLELIVGLAFVIGGGTGVFFTLT